MGRKVHYGYALGLPTGEKEDVQPWAGSLHLLLGMHVLTSFSAGARAICLLPAHASVLKNTFCLVSSVGSSSSLLSYLPSVYLSPFPAASHCTCTACLHAPAFLPLLFFCYSLLARGLCCLCWAGRATAPPSTPPTCIPPHSWLPTLRILACRQAVQQKGLQERRGRGCLCCGSTCHISPWALMTSSLVC